MANEKIGENLFMCIPPDHVRDDLPSTVTIADLNCKQLNTGKSQYDTPVYVGVTDDMGNTVMLPCFDVQFIDGKVIVMAHRTGRPVK